MNNINMKHDMPPNGRDNNDNNAVITTPIEIFYQIVFLGKHLYKRANSHLSTEDQTKNLKQLIFLILSIIGLLIVNTAYAVYWSFLVRRFGTSLQEKNETEFYNVIYEVLVNLLLKLPLSSLSEFCRGRLSLFLQRHCTQAFFNSFFNSKSKYFSYKG